MQSFIFFFIVRVCAMSLAMDVSVYNFYDYYLLLQRGTEFDFSIPWKFSFTSSDELYMVINIFNKPPSVTMTKVAYESVSDLKTSRVRIPTGKEVRMFYHPLSGPELIINLNFYTSNGLCKSIKVAEGRLDSTLRHEKTKKEYKYHNICFKGKKQPCVLLVNLEDLTCNGPPIVTRKYENANTTTPLTDLLNNNTIFVSSSSHENMTTSTNGLANITETNDQQQPSQSKVLIYVITSTIAMCIIILLTYIGVKKYCHRKSHPVETREVNTYATANEVVYADLSLMHGDGQPPRREEESPYAKIIGVLKPHLN